jgi:hypothetical protein
VAERKKRVEESIVKYDKHPFLNGVANPNLTVEEDEATAASLFVYLPLFVSNQSLTKQDTLKKRPSTSTNCGR